MAPKDHNQSYRSIRVTCERLLDMQERLVSIITEQPVEMESLLALKVRSISKTVPVVQYLRIEPSATTMAQRLAAVLSAEEDLWTDVRRLQTQREGQQARSSSPHFRSDTTVAQQEAAPEDQAPRQPSARRTEEVDDCEVVVEPLVEQPRALRRKRPRDDLHDPAEPEAMLKVIWIEGGKETVLLESSTGTLTKSQLKRKFAECLEN